MVRGIDTFSRYFAGFEDRYVLIGGVRPHGVETVCTYTPEGGGLCRSAGTESGPARLAEIPWYARQP